MPVDTKQVERSSVWIDKTLIRQAKTISSHEDKTLSEVIEGILRSPLNAKLRKVAEKMTVELGGES